MFVFPKSFSEGPFLRIVAGFVCGWSIIKYGCHHFLCLVNKTSPVLVRLVDMLIIFMTHEQCTVTAWLHLAFLYVVQQYSFTYHIWIMLLLHSLVATLL